MGNTNNTKDALTTDIMSRMLATSGSGLSGDQIKILKDTIEDSLSKYNITTDLDKASIIDIQEENARVLKNFISAKQIEGRSTTTLYGYAREVTKLFIATNKLYKEINTQDIRDYLAWRKTCSHLQASSLQNSRMYLCSFFKWCFVEELILKNPMDRIGVIKQEQHVVKVLSDEEQEMIICACENERDRAIIDMLSGTGMRVSELCGLNRESVNFDTGEIIVFGKGSKERYCFLTGKAKVHLKWYLKSRTDDNEALFVTINKPHTRLTKNGIEYILKNIARKTGIETLHLYPHKYRSTLATNMINRGAPAEMVQGILGHASVSTTLKSYTKINKEKYKQTHHDYVQ